MLQIWESDGLSQLVDMEAYLRLGIFVVVLLLMAAWEILAPRRQLTQIKSGRWINNLALLVFNSLLLRILFPAATVGFSLYADNEGWGLLHQLEWPTWLSVTIAILVLDLVIYLQHVLFHRVSLLWRLHRIHHMDLDFDFTTGLRFHPIEIILSMLIKFVTIVLLGAPVAAVIIFEIVLNSASMFNHGNIRIPKIADRLIRLLIVTPDMHRVHHSCRRQETDSNYGFNLSVWDRLFRTYRDQPEAGHEVMIIGLENPRRPKQCIPISALLKSPFINYE